MMHHLDGHAGCDCGHDMKLIHGGGIMRVNSYHHQMCIPGPKTIVIGVSNDNRSSRYIGRNDEPEEWNEGETEAIYMPHINAVAVQFHPEWMKECVATRWYRSLVEDFVTLPREEFEYIHVPRRAKHAAI